MADSLFKRLNAARKRRTHALGQDISTPRGRRMAWVHFNLVDHAFLRHLWTNRHKVAEGVYRSNQPGPARVRKEAAAGIKTIISLRGNKGGSHRLFEIEAAQDAGITMEFVKLGAGSLVPPEEFARLFELFDTAQRPILMHCKSGADRAGLASTLYLMDREGKSFKEASDQLHWRYMHSRRSRRTGILYYMMDQYRAENETTPISIREWLATRYDPKAITAAYRKSRGMKPLE
ncbi:MAG: sulfur transferase domain-containing protein [Pseudomonadota bacterium]